MIEKYEGVYDSAYTMDRDQGSSIIRDVIVLVREDSGIIGIGNTDNDGHTMLLSLAEQSGGMVGEWRERDRENQTVHSGELELVHDGLGRLFGAWSQQTADGLSHGTWALVSRQ